MARAGAVLVRRANARACVPASVARQIVPQTTVSRVPNSALGMALVGGHVVAVIELGEPSGALLLCEHDGELLALSGLHIERVGFFELDAHGAQVDGVNVPLLQLPQPFTTRSDLS